tara:strand:+ start:1963 stop:2112 length:150 start_codon:yes stop_codon:yes gene_type:complete
MNKTKSMKIETPLITIESDSGNHTNDFMSIVGVMLIFVALRWILKKYIR